MPKSLGMTPEARRAALDANISSQHARTGDRINTDSWNGVAGAGPALRVPAGSFAPPPGSPVNVSSSPTSMRHNANKPID